MNNSKINKIFIPLEIQNIIFSYAMSPQQKILLNDIQSFVSTKKLLYNIYENDHDTFLNDIYLFLGLDFVDLFIKFKTMKDVIKFALYEFTRKPVRIQIHFLLSSMSPDERNNYIVHYFT